MKKIVFVLIFTAMFLHMVPEAGAQFGRDIWYSDFVPRPRLLRPRGETVDLKGQLYLAFAWSPHEGRQLSGKYYDFRIYKGFEMLEKNLIFKERLSGKTRSIDVDENMFETGQVYTWSLRLGYRSSGKSSRSYDSFTVTREDVKSGSGV